jgi:hypothetical protein
MKSSRMGYPNPNLKFLGTQIFGFTLYQVHSRVVFLETRNMESPNNPTWIFELARTPRANSDGSGAGAFPSLHHLVRSGSGLWRHSGYDECWFACPTFYIALREGGVHSQEVAATTNQGAIWAEWWIRSLWPFPPRRLIQHSPPWCSLINS